MSLNLNQFMSQLGSIGGISRCGQPGFFLLVALWDKAIELNSPKFSISNIELGFNAGFVSNKRFFEVRKALKEQGFMKFESIPGSKSMSYYYLNTDLIGIATRTGEQEIRTDSGMDSRIDSGMDSRTDGSLEMLVNSFSRRVD